MDRKYVGILLICVGLLLLIGIIYIVFIYRFSSPPPLEVSNTPAVQENKQSPLPVEEKAPVRFEASKKVNPSQLTQNDLSRMAASFAERFGSFSNQSNYSNIEDLKIFMSENMKVWADNYIKEVTLKKTDSSIYYGITTKAVSENIKQFDDDLGKAEILIRTKRREATGTTSNESFFYQDILINFVKENGSWKIDSAFWQAK